MNSRVFTICMTSMVVVAFASSSSAMVSGHDDTDTILRISKLRINAIYNDKPTYARYTSAALQAIDPAGGLVGKVHVIADKPTYPDSLSWKGTPRVRFIGDVAQVTGYAEEIEQFPGGTIVTNFRRTELYAKERGQWVVEATQVTIVPKNFAKSMAQPPTNLRQFVGRYEWASGKIEILSEKGGQLISTLDGTSEPLIFTAADATTLADDLGVGKFYRDRSGTVAGYIYTKCDGQSLRIKKLP